MTASIRTSSLADLDLHVRHRGAMFRDMVMGDEAGLVRMSDRFRIWLRPRLLTGEVRGLVREVHGVAVGSGLLWLREQMPVPLTELDLRGQVFNVFVEPAHRGQGHARALMVSLEAAASEWGVEILELHASKDAEALYQSLGYEATSEMRKVLKADLPVPHQWKDRR
ncbi:MAG: GNAT family N-acetyltransferase [Acidobacteria bacterium]|nr:GNAT family N-acetyltransferase [Acidobacteriota bacterium]